MPRLGRIIALAAVVTASFLLLLPTDAGGQLVCEGEHETFTTACLLGVPDEQGVTIREAITRPGQVRAYKFLVGPGPRAAHVYIGDLWYDVDASLWRDPPNEVIIREWHLVREAATFQQRVLQFVRPEQIIEELEPYLYTLFIYAGDQRTFDANHPFTVRVALGPPVCGVQRDSTERYQLSLTQRPPAQEVTPFALLSFNAIVSPPYSDLFDFDWRLDGQPVQEPLRETMQLPASDLPTTPGDMHRVQVTARGVREYPDPDPRGRHMPPTLSVECTFPGPQAVSPRG